ncbi:MAG: hypothetical protein QXS81_04185 [Candidatus Micrarchaeaceae archaeon]
MYNGKKQLGQYFTSKDLWLKDNIKEFILKSKCTVAYDPFAGNGDLLRVASELGFKKTIGLDIDRNLGWKYNNSLIKIPHIKDAIIITNPPYLTNYSAKRKHIWKDVEDMFRLTNYNDLYLLALENMLKAQDFVVAIVPETFINTTFPKDRVYSINILEENPFDDTENPVSVVCFDNKSKSPYDVKVYKNDHFSSTLGDLLDKRLTPNYKHKIKFNCPTGLIALRAVDTTDPKRRIEFMQKDQLDYDLKRIKKSSRLITVIDVKLNTKLESYIELCNKILNKYREDTNDILLSPFKGNTKNGIRRRRLDYKTARAIMEIALDYSENIIGHQRKLLALANS